MTRIFLVLAALAMLQSRAEAQGVGFLVPSISFAVLTDSNVLWTPGEGQSDVIQRTTPRLRTGYRRALWEVAGGYTFDTDQFQRAPALSRPIARQLVDGNFGYTGRVATFSATSSYLTTNTPTEINNETALFIARAPAARTAVGTALTYQLRPLTRATGEFQFEDSRLLQPDMTAGQVRAATTRNLRLGIEQRVSGVDALLVAYQERWYAFAGAPDATGLLPSVSRTTTIGWVRDVSPLTQMSIQAGPRISNGRPRLEFAFDARRRLRSGSLSVGAARTEQGALGQAGAIEISRLAASLTLQPFSRLGLQVTPSLRRDVALAFDLSALISIIDVTATGTLTRWLSIDAGYTGTRQRGDSPQFGSLRFARDVLTIRATATLPGPASAQAQQEPPR